MVQNTLNTTLGTLMVESSTAVTNNGGGNNSGAVSTNSTINTDSSLTPTTLKSITQIFESDDCLNTLNKIQDDGFAVPLPVTVQSRTARQQQPTSARRSFFNLDSKALQGGSITVLTPTKSEAVTILQALPEPVITSNQPFMTPTVLNNAPPVQTTSTMASSMRTRSSTREQTAIHTNRRQSTSRQEAEPKAKTPKKTPTARRTRVNKIDEDELTPEESQRLHVRRERNKAAAARCRKRRVDQINTLSAEVEQWEGKKRIMEETIAQLRAQKDELEYILSQHRGECRLAYPEAPQMAAATVAMPVVAVKSEPVIVEPVEQLYVVQNHHQQMLTLAAAAAPTTTTTTSKPKRPLSLKIDRPAASVEGVTIETPSSVIPSLGFDSLMTSTGLTPTCNIVTPVSFSNPSCSSQQRSTELATIDLNTPSGETLSLLSL